MKSDFVLQPNTQTASRSVSFTRAVGRNGSSKMRLRWKGGVGRRMRGVSEKRLQTKLAVNQRAMSFRAGSGSNGGFVFQGGKRPPVVRDTR